MAHPGVDAAPKILNRRDLRMKYGGLDPDISERTFHLWLRDVARAAGWRDYSKMNQWGARPGFPDFLCVRPPRLIFVELKTKKGVASKHQKAWRDDLLGVPGVEYYLWRPAHEAEIFRTLGDPTREFER